MEHISEILTQWSETNNNILNQEQIKSLNEYARLIHEENKKYNLTGYKTIEEIINNLITGSISPLINLEVPRGTFFADIGTGAGIPGIPFAVLFPQAKGMLIDSNHKKTDFITYAARTMNLENITTGYGRIEELDASYIESFDLVLSRALGNPYLVSEIAAPFIKKDGLLYIYANQTTEDLHEDIIIHAKDTGLAPASLKEHCFASEGFLFKKVSATPEKYPRRFAVIKREAKKYTEM